MQLVTIREQLTHQDYRTVYIVTPGMTVAALKTIVSRDCQNHVMLPIAAQRLMFNNAELQEGEKLWEIVEEGGFRFIVLALLIHSKVNKLDG